LKEMLQDQVYLHHGELRSSPDQNLSQWFSQNKNEPLVRLSDRESVFSKRIQLILRIYDACGNHQFLTWESMLKFGNQTHSNMCEHYNLIASSNHL
jgi:hypothetical protein